MRGATFLWAEMGQFPIWRGVLLNCRAFPIPGAVCCEICGIGDFVMLVVAFAVSLGSSAPETNGRILVEPSCRQVALGNDSEATELSWRCSLYLAM